MFSRLAKSARPSATSSPGSNTMTKCRTPLASLRLLYCILLECHCRKLRDVQRVATRRLLDLFPAAKAVGDDQRIRIEISNSRKQHALAACDRDVIVLFFKSECARHAAAAGVGHLVLH